MARPKKTTTAAPEAANPTPNPTPAPAPARRLPTNKTEAFEIIVQVCQSFKGDRLDHAMIDEAIKIIGLESGVLTLEKPPAAPTPEPPAQS